MTETKNIHYIFPEEPVLYIKYKSKRYIENVIFMAGIACPMWVAGTESWFNELIGI